MKKNNFVIKIFSILIVSLIFNLAKAQEVSFPYNGTTNLTQTSGTTINQGIKISLNDLDIINNFFTQGENTIYMYIALETDNNLATWENPYGTLSNTATLIPVQLTNDSNVNASPNNYSIVFNPLKYFGSVPAGTMVYGYHLLFRNQFGTGGNNQTVNLYIDLADQAFTATCVGGAGEYNDYDCDGILNIVDIDDDNDGIPDSIERTCVGSVINGDFEVPAQNCSPANFSIIPSTDVPGWDSTGGYNFGYICGNPTGAPIGNFEIWTSGYNAGSGPVPAYSGNQFVEINAWTAGTLLQSITLPSAGYYVVEWSCAHRGRAGTDVMRVSVKQGSTYLDQQTVSDGNTSWRYVSGSLGIHATSTTIDFAFEAVSTSTGNPSAGNLIDKVYVCVSRDTDGDEIPDYLDLDSDNDGCPDAVEGTASILDNQVVSSSMPGGNTAVATSGNYYLPVTKTLCASTTCVDYQGLPQFTPTVPTDYSNSAGQGIGLADNPSLGTNACKCFYAPASGGTVLDTNHGITALGRAGEHDGDGNSANDWPMVRKGAWTALEAKSKGFVVNRVPTTASLSNITNPVEGMMVYDEEADCLKIYTKDDAPATTYSWRCFGTQTCPDVL